MGIFKKETKEYYDNYPQTQYKPKPQAIPFERTGPVKTWFMWKQIDFAFRSDHEREYALISKRYIPENNLPLGIEIYKNRIFVTLPKWREGIPCTLAVIQKDQNEQSPLLVPYPNWNWYKTGKIHNNIKLSS